MVKLHCIKEGLKEVITFKDMDEAWEYLNRHRDVHIIYFLEGGKYNV